MLDFLTADKTDEKLSLTDKEVQELNAFFLTRPKSEIEVLSMRFCLGDEKPPYSKETLETVFTALAKMAEAKKNRRRRQRTAGLKDYIESSDEESTEEAKN